MDTGYRVWIRLLFQTVFSDTAEEDRRNMGKWGRIGTFFVSPQPQGYSNNPGSKGGSDNKHISFTVLKENMILSLY